jgi:hypothetical protein
MGDGVISAIRMPTKTTPTAQFGLGWRSSGASELRSAWSRSAISSGPETQERGIVGETPNLAARLQGIAEPNILSSPR